MLSNNTKLIITGGVGVGKTTTINSVCQALTNKGVKYIVVPEYIDGDENGNNMLDKFINHDITAFEFQYYILQYFDDYLSKLKIAGDEILIFERLPDDSVTCFANINVKNKLISEEEFKVLYTTCVNLDKKYNLPSYFTNFSNNDLLFCKTFRTGDNVNEIISRLNYSIKNNKNLLVGLYNSNDECLLRIRQRNRPSEVKSYTIDVVNRFNTHYEIIYNILRNNRHLEYEDLHSLII